MKKSDYYQYVPSIAAGSLFTALFAILTLIHGYLIGKKRTWYFIPFLIGCIFEFIGYIGRIVGSTEKGPTYGLPAYVVQSLLLLLGPTLYAASIYMILSRLIVLLDAESLSPIKRKWLTASFVTGDVLSFVVQAIGGGRLANADTKKEQDTGKAIILVGIFIQIVFFGLFVIVTCVFHYRIFKKPTARSYSITVPWRGFLNALYAASILIMIRSIFRVVEYWTGKKGELQSHEVYIYVLDGLPMFLVAVLFVVLHPSRIISSHKQLSSRGSDTEVQDVSFQMNGIPSADSSSQTPPRRMK